MRRTNRGKDWPFVTALGVKLLETGDPHGWLHLFNYDVLLQTAEKLPCPPEVIALRPVLGLLRVRDKRLEVALRGEMESWNQLDRLRIRVYEQAVRPYRLAVKRDRRARDPALHTQHLVRVEHAERLLPVNPLRQHGLERLIAQARAQAARLVPGGALKWLRHVRGCFMGLPE